jgi:hypothetical protein
MGRHAALTVRITSATIQSFLPGKAAANSRDCLVLLSCESRSFFAISASAVEHTSAGQRFPARLFNFEYMKWQHDRLLQCLVQGEFTRPILVQLTRDFGSV